MFLCNVLLIKKNVFQTKMMHLDAIHSNYLATLANASNYVNIFLHHFLGIFFFGLSLERMCIKVAYQYNHLLAMLFALTVCFLTTCFYRSDWLDDNINVIYRYTIDCYSLFFILILFKIQIGVFFLLFCVLF